MKAHIVGGGFGGLAAAAYLILIDARGQGGNDRRRSSAPGRCKSPRNARSSR